MGHISIQGSWYLPVTAVEGRATPRVHMHADVGMLIDKLVLRRSPSGLVGGLQGPASSCWAFMEIERASEACIVLW